MDRRVKDRIKARVMAAWDSLHGERERKLAMVDWVTPEVGITDSVEGRHIAQGGDFQQDLERRRGGQFAPAVINVVAHGVNPAASFNRPMLQPQFSLELMDEVAALIERLEVTDYTVVVHCGGGVERSPLAVAWWLHKYRGLNLDQAFAKVIAARPGALDRRSWIQGTR